MRFADVVLFLQYFNSVCTMRIGLIWPQCLAAENLPTPEGITDIAVVSLISRLNDLNDTTSCLTSLTISCTAGWTPGCIL